MKKDILLGGFVLVLILGGIVLYAASGSSPASAPASPAGSIHEDAAYYTIDAAWPTTTSLAQSAGAPADAAAVQEMSQAIEGQVTNFKSDNQLASITPEEAQFYGITSEHKYALDISYEATSSPATVSYIFTIYSDTLGAHPNGTYATFTFDSATGAQLGLADLFANGFINGTANPAVASELSQIARAKLPAIIAQREGTAPDQVDPSMLDAGTAPSLGNFSWFYLAGDQLVLLFPPYQVGPYSLGTITLALPLANLPDLKPQYR